MNLEQLRDRVRRLTGVRLVELLPDADLDALLNEAYREVAGYRQWPFLRADLELTATPGSPGVEVPTQFRHITGVVLPGGSRLRQVTLAELDELSYETGEPALYARADQSNLHLWPAPESPTTLLVRLQRQPPDLVADTDSPEFDTEFHPTLAYMAAARVLAEEGDDSGRAQMYAEEVGGFLARMEDRYLAAQDAGMFVMGGGGRRRRLPHR